MRIASVSSGIDFSVPSLSAAVVRNQGEMGQGREDNGVDDDANGYVDDAYGYDVLREYKSPRDSRLALGTYAASMWVGEQRRGFASDSRPLLFRGFVRGAGLIPVRVVNETGLTSLEATMQGIRYAAARGARIIHLEVTLQTAAGQPLCDVIREVGLRGSLVVAPAGNRGLEVGPRDFPAACDADNLVIVAATDASGALARFSSYGASRVDVAAPGVDIAGLDSTGTITTRTGTGSASALVSGVAALLAAARPGETPQHLKRRLVLGSDDTPSLYDKVAGKGRLNAMKAFTTKDR